MTEDWDSDFSQGLGSTLDPEYNPGKEQMSSDQGCRLSATLRLVESGHILAEQRHVSARWRRGHEWAARCLSKGLSIDLSTKCWEVCCVLVAESEMITLGHHAMIVAVILFRILYWICRAGKLNSSKVSLKTCCIPFLYLCQRFSGIF